MLAIIRALEEWLHFLEGAQVKFEIWTDHKNLKYFWTSTEEKLGGLSTYPILTSHFTIDLAEAWAKQMHSPGGPTMAQEQETTRI